MNVCERVNRNKLSPFVEQIVIVILTIIVYRFFEIDQTADLVI